MWIPSPQSLRLTKCRKTFLRENTIAVIPPCGYTPENKQSIIALKTLAYIPRRDDIAIRHACNHG